MQVKGGCAAKMHFAVDAYLEDEAMDDIVARSLVKGSLGVSDLLEMLSLCGATTSPRSNPGPPTARNSACPNAPNIEAIPVNMAR